MKVDFILRIVIVALKRQLREIQAVADIDHSRIVQPFHTSSIVTEASAGGNFGDLKLLVVLGKLHGNVVEYIQDPGLVDALGIFANVLLVVRDELPLNLKRPLKGSFFNELTDNSGHSAQDAVVKEE